eukprot:853880-Karenia_brevis.AAC.1
MKNTYAVPIRYYKGKPRFVRSHRLSGKLPGWGKLIELCTSPDSTLGKTALQFGKRITVYRVTQREDFGNPTFVSQLHDQARSCPGISLHGSLPCTPWSQWQPMSIHRYGKRYAFRLQAARAKSRRLLANSIWIADEILKSGGE